MWADLSVISARRRGKTWPGHTCCHEDSQPQQKMWFDAVSIFHSCLIYHQVWTHDRLLQPEGLLCDSLRVRTLQPHWAVTKPPISPKTRPKSRRKAGEINHNKRLAQHLKRDRQAGRVGVNKMCRHKQTNVPVTDCKFRLTCKCWICFQSEAHFACQSDGHTQTFNICPMIYFYFSPRANIRHSKKKKNVTHFWI